MQITRHLMPRSGMLGTCFHPIIYIYNATLRRTDNYDKVVGRNRFCPLFARQKACLHEDHIEFTKLIKTFTFMLPCIVIDFFLYNQPDAPIIQIYSVTKFYIFRTSSLPIIRSFLLYIRHCKFHVGLMTTCKNSQDGTAVSSWLCLEAVIKNLHETYQCRMYSRKLLMMGREDARKMWSFITE